MAEPSASRGRGTLRSDKLAASIESLEKFRDPRPIPAWASQRLGARSKASGTQSRMSSTGRSTLGTTLGRSGKAASGGSTLGGLGHAPAVPVMEMGASNIPLKFASSSASQPVLPRPRGSKGVVRPFPGGVRKAPSATHSAHGVAIVREAAATTAMESTSKTAESATSGLTAAEREASLTLVLDLLGDGAEEDPEVR